MAHAKGDLTSLLPVDNKSAVGQMFILKTADPIATVAGANYLAQSAPRLAVGHTILCMTDVGGAPVKASWKVVTAVNQTPGALSVTLAAFS